MAKTRLIVVTNGSEFLEFYTDHPGEIEVEVLDLDLVSDDPTVANADNVRANALHAELSRMQRIFTVDEEEQPTPGSSGTQRGPSP